LPAIHLSGMETKRQKQIGELLRRQFSMVLLEEGGYIFDKAMVTVTRVVISPDLMIAKVYLSVYNTDNKQEVMLSLDQHQHQLRHALAAKVGKQMRRIPDLKFFLDDSLDEYFRMDRILNQLRADNQMGADEEE
jgi:ribosome-binding factor A